MERYGFATYLVDEHNQEAFSLCHDIANLKSEVRQPITIIGDTGTGKTHLLYSIIGHVRATTDTTGLAYVNADEFPQAVRDLVTHPQPVEGASSAILLVDQLERFSVDLDALESVIRLFLEHGHDVVCASRVHLSRLRLPGGLAHLLDNGHRVTIAPQDSPTRIELLENTIRAEHDEVITRLENELAELRTFLTSASETHGEDEDDEPLLLSLRKELELTRTELNVLYAKNTQGSETASISSPIPSDVLEELEELRAEHALNAVASKEATGLRNQIERLESERDELRRQLEAAPAIAEGSEDAIHAEARKLVERAEQLVTEMQTNREEFTQSQELHTKQLEEIRELERIFQKHEQHSDDSTTVASELESQLNAYKESIALMEQERDTLQGQVVALQTTESAQQDAMNTIRHELLELQGQLERKTEMIVKLDLALEDAKKRESVAELRVNNQIQQYEARIAELEASNRELKQNEKHLYDELQKFDASLGEAASWIRATLDAYLNEQADNPQSPTLALDTDLADVDTLEGAALLDRLDLTIPFPEDDDEPKQTDDRSDHAQDVDDNDQTQRMHVSGLQHAEELRESIDVLLTGEAYHDDESTDEEESA